MDQTETHKKLEQIEILLCLTWQRVNILSECVCICTASLSSIRKTTATIGERASQNGRKKKFKLKTIFSFIISCIL